jgi:hypothetical protein
MVEVADVFICGNCVNSLMMDMQYPKHVGEEK